MKQMIIIFCLVIFSFPTFADESVKTQVIDLQVTEEGFQPSTFEVDSHSSVTLNVTRKTDNTCATEIQIKGKKIKKDLPLNQIVTIELGKLKKGKLDFACGMNMLKGSIKVK